MDRKFGWKCPDTHSILEWYLSKYRRACSNEPVFKGNIPKHILMSVYPGLENIFLIQEKKIISQFQVFTINTYRDNHKKQIEMTYFIKSLLIFLNTYIEYH